MVCLADARGLRSGTWRAGTATTGGAPRACPDASRRLRTKVAAMAHELEPGWKLARHRGGFLQGTDRPGPARAGRACHAACTITTTRSTPPARPTAAHA